LKILK